MDFLKLLALVLIIEGLGPFLVPQTWQNYLRQMAQMPTEQMRIVGGILLLVGALILFMV
ncbi:DUF2065 domain-containing protein [Catenovulum sp. 2E275]|uniref:DUF2065 domain-containing protein n=1 Tax=Catenovulum sp. 2E275 TaxID=2980497 RepID=UPI0021CE0DE3|nr:DUF2065 domain-containing protein [Catenovulum sp. 2E275]MCU4676334.1 DUF2065 domain-containing protein [Catenovulum sp. 2E275]